MPEIEAIGDAATGGILGRAVEPDAGEGDGLTEERACLNCGCELRGDYCHCCGQRAHVHRTLGAFWHDLLHGVLHFEGKIWRTLPLLVWKPGELTRRYIEGQRASFVSPIALFLFSVFLMFAVVSALGGPFTLNPTDARSQARVEREYQEERSDLMAELADLQTRREALAATGADTAEVDAQIVSARRGLELQEAVFSTLGRRATQAVEEDPAGVVEVNTEGLDGSLGWFDGAYRKAKENPSLLFYKLQTNAYKFSWALIPISVPFVWLLFLHRRRYRRFGPYDHTVFVTYSIAFMTLGFVFLTLIRPLGLEPLSNWLLLIVPPLHMYRQLRGAYELDRWSAAWRTAGLALFAFVAAAIFLGLLLMAGVLG